MKLRIPLLLISTLAPLALPTVAQARVAGSEPERSVALELDVSRLPDDELTEDLSSHAIKHQEEVLARAGVRVSDDAKDVVRLEISRFGTNGVHYRGRLSIVGDAESTRDFECEVCTDTEFLQMIEVETALIVRGLGAEEAAEAVGVAPTLTPEEVVVEEDEPEARGQRVGGLGWAGVGVGLVGAGVAVGGAVLLPRDLVTRGLPGMVDARSPRTLGIGLLAGGGVVLVAGLSMLAVDLVRRRPSKIALIPHGGSHHAGVTVTVRF